MHPLRSPGSAGHALRPFQLPAQVKLGFSFFTASLGLFRSFFSFSEIIPLSLTGTSRLPASPLHRQLRNIFRAALLFICQGADALPQTSLFFLRDSFVILSRHLLCVKHFFLLFYYYYGINRFLYFLQTLSSLIIA